MTHQQLTTQVDQIKYAFPEIESLSWDELSELSDSELIEYLETEDVFNFDMSIQTNF